MLFPLLLFQADVQTSTYPGGLSGLLLSQGGGKSGLQTYTGGMCGLLFSQGGGFAAGLSPAQQPASVEMRMSLDMGL